MWVLNDNAPNLQLLCFQYVSASLCPSEQHSIESDIFEQSFVLLRVDSSVLMIHVFLSEGKLYYVGAKKEEKREVVIEAERKRQIFLDCHFNDIGHHLGQKKTVHRIQSKYYWLGIIRDVVDWVQRVFGILITSPGRSC